jgi:hypothetical protein
MISCDSARIHPKDESPILDLDADDFRLKNDISVDDALDGAEEAAVALPDLLAEDVHLCRRNDLLAEPAVFNAAEPNEAGPADEPAGVERGELGGGLDHQDAGEERPAGDVAGNPEFIGSDVFISDQAMVIGVNVDDAVEHLHVAAMRIGLTNRLLIENLFAEVETGNIKKQLRRHESKRRR